MSISINDKVTSFKRQLLADALEQCSDKQRALFRRLYPEPIPDDKLIQAIDLCERTIKKNLADPSRVTPQAREKGEG